MIAILKKFFDFCEYKKAVRGGGVDRSCARRDVHFALEMCILLSRGAVKGARSGAKCTFRRPRGRGGPARRPG